MLANVLRDAETMPALREAVAYRGQWLAQVEERLAQGWDGDVGQVRHAIALAVDFRTWQTLVRKRRLNSDGAIRLMVAIEAPFTNSTSGGAVLREVTPAILAQPSRVLELGDQLGDGLVPAVLPAPCHRRPGLSRLWSQRQILESGR